MIKTFKRRLFITFFAVFMAGQAFAQFGNEWIRFNQSYYKILVAKDGLYRLTHTDLQNAGFPVSSVDPRRIQLFHRGVEQRLRVEGESDAVFNPTDYIEFYGRRNDGTSDVELYQPSSTQPHPYYNLYSDTTSYFLTVNSLVQPGLRVQPFMEINVTNIPVETHHQDQKLLLLTVDYSTGKRYSNFIQNTFFETGEGWTGASITKNLFIDYLIENVTSTAPSFGTPQLEVQVVGRAELTHRVEISVGPTTPTRVVATVDFGPSDVATINEPLNWSDIGADGRVFVRVKALGIGAASDRLSASYIKVNFPQNYNQAGAAEKVFQLNENAANKSYIEIQNAPAGTRLFDITDPYNIVPIGTTSTTTLNAVVPNTAMSRKIFAANTFMTPAIHAVSFRNIDPALHDYIIISHRALMKPAGEYSNVVKAYGAYRSSTAGGSYDTLIVDIKQLYNQFNYGEISPLAIHRFMKFMMNSGTPRHLFIIGKGLDVWLGYHRNPTAFAFHDYVPSAGMPASDIVYTAGLGSTNFEPAVPTGRITANTAQDVAAYLNKVKEMEALSYTELWRKELLHLSGGINPGEPELFKGFMEQFGAIAENYYLGGHVSAIAKNNTEIEFINIADKVNAGVNLITLFGHSSPDQNDFNIGFVSAPELGYNNPDKYPMFLINGCNAGDFFYTAIRYGEDWINTPSKGAVGFMANTSFGYSTLLRGYTDTFYSVAYGDSSYIDKGIGEIQQEVVKRFMNISTTVPYVTQAQQMLLLGDPAVRLFGAGKPDYETKDDHLYYESYNDDPVTALSDSFAIKIIVRNFGRAREDTLRVQVTRTFSDNTSVTYDSLFLPVLYSDTLTFTIRHEDKGFGNNTFTITIDPQDEFSELDETNNTGVLSVFIPLNASRNLYPQGFSIVNSGTTNLVVQSTNILDDPRDFILQMDTVDTFDSPYLQEFTVNGKLVTQTVNLITTVDTLAFYWRSRFATPQPNEDTTWATTSFTYIENGNEGWAQVHFPQYMSNETTAGLVLDPEARLLRFKETVTDVAIHTYGANHASPHTMVSVRLNQSEYNPQSFPELQCRDNTINLIAFDRTTTFPYVAIPVQYPDKRACGRRPEAITSFLSTEVEIGNGKDLIQFVDNVQLGDSVVLFSIGNAGFASWSANVRNKLGEFGISTAQIAALLPGEPVIIFTKKGAAPGSALILKTSLAPPDQQELEGEGTITGRFVSGSMTSSLIGPAVDWQSFTQKVRVLDVPVTDVYTFDVIGVTITGEETVLKPEVVATTTDLSDIDASTYPYLRLAFHAADDINLTSPQVAHWLVEFIPAAEGVLVYNGPTESQHLNEGESWTGSYGFQNISPKTFSDSLTVQYTVFNTTTRTSDIRTEKLGAPAPGQTTSFDLTINTEGKAGLNDFNVYVNPRILPELYYDNNVLDLKDYLVVEPDIFNPVLDVTIDGRYLLQGDFVSANPAIVIKVWDENSLLLKTDTTGVKILLMYPCDQEECAFIPIYFTRPDVQWFPATTTSDFRVEFNPQDLPEGTYTLRVEATDAGNNASGTDPYEISFVVTADNSIVLNPPYPNPSPDVFFFSVVISSDNAPDLMRLEIINSNGLSVGEFVQDNLYTGTNVIPWNSRTFPSGLYLYRMVVLRDGKEIKTANGKLLLLR